MKKWTSLSVALLLVLPIGLVGCGAGATVGGDLDNLTEDSNDNGFLDVEPPDGVEFLTVDNVNIRLRNTVSQEDLGGLAAQFGVDPALLNLVEIVANIEVELDYGAGITDTIVESESIEPFDRRFEIACPDSLNVDVGVIAQVPLVGPQDVTDFVVNLTEGTEFECGQTVEVEVVVDENGNPDVSLSIE